MHVSLCMQNVCNVGKFFFVLIQQSRFSLLPNFVEIEVAGCEPEM